MRKDVKVGLVLSLVVVVVAGLYYVGRDKKADPVKLDDSPAVAEKTPGPAKGPVADARDQRPKPAANRAGGAAKPVIPPNNTRIKPPAAGSLTPPPEGGSGVAVKPEPARAEPPAVAKSDAGSSSPSAGPSTAKDAGPEPVASATPKSEPFNNLFQFGKDPGAPTTPGGTEPAAAPSGQDAKPQSGSGARTDDAASNTNRSTPPAQPGPAKPVESGEPIRTHKVERGDSYSLLAEQYYGSQRYAQFLIDSNPQYADPTKLREGIVLKVPPRPADSPATVKKASVPAPTAAPKGDAADKSATAASGSGGRVYVVQEDDTLYGIASREMGKGTRWPELLDLNKEVLKGSPERLRVGQKLKLPTPEKADTTKKP